MRYVLYHKNCYDGFGSAYSAWKKFGYINTQYIPINYGDPFPDFSLAEEVYILDFSFKRNVLLDMDTKGYKIYLLDHHKTAEEDLKDLQLKNGTIVFDMNRSGALISWEYFHGSNNIPELIKYISDRDLWLHKLDKSKEVNSVLMSYPMNFETWDKLDVEKMKSEGETSLRVRSEIVNKICENSYIGKILEYEVPMVNTASFWSDVGDKLIKLYPNHKFVASYTIFQNDVMWSLRCKDDFDVSEIAKKFGGGGHKKASGFRTNKV